MEIKYILFLLIFSFLYLISCEPHHLDLKLNKKVTGSLLKDNSYHFYKLVLNSNIESSNQNLILRVDEDKSKIKENSSLDFFSDPDLFVSQENKFPNSTETSTWYCNEFGSDIVAISNEFVLPNSTFYIGVYCKTKCHYILDSYLDETYKLKEFTMYFLQIPKGRSMIYEFRTKSVPFKHLSFQFMGVGMPKYKVYISKQIPSSSNSFELEPAWTNGYFYDLYQDSPEYCLNCSFYILIKALETGIQAKILITYRGFEVPIHQKHSVFDTIQIGKKRCYFYSMKDFPPKDSLILNLVLFGGSVIVKLFGYDSNVQMNYNEIINSKNTYEIIGERVLILSQEEINKYKELSVNKNYSDFHFCIYSKQKTSYLLGIHYSSLTQAMQRVNFLTIGQTVKDYVPFGQITKYKVFDISYESNIKITMEAIQGKPNIHFIYQNRWDIFITRGNFNYLKSFGALKEPNSHNKEQTIFIKDEKNICHNYFKKAISLYGDISRISCNLVVVIDCLQFSTEDPDDLKNDCIFKLTSITDKSKQSIIPKTTYYGILSKDDYNDYIFNIEDSEVTQLTIVLNIISGELKLKLFSINNGDESKIFIEEKSKKDFLPKVIILKSTHSLFKKRGSLKGKYLIKVESTSFSTFTLYYYSCNKQQDTKIDLYSVDLNLANGQMIQSFFDDKVYKIYSYEIYEGIENDIRITLTERNMNLNIYVYDNINKIEYDFIDRSISHLKDTDITKNFDKLIVFKNYLWMNLYESKQIIISQNDSLLKSLVKDKNLLYIVISKKYYASKKISYISYLNQNTFYLGITNNKVPLKLFENIPHQVMLNKKNNFGEQKYLFVHSDNSKKLSFAINVKSGCISFIIQINKINKIYYQNELIKNNEFITIPTKDLFKYCKNSGCELTLTVKQESVENPLYMIFAHSNDNSPLQLNPGVLMQNQIQVGEKHYYILDFNPIEYEDMHTLGNILVRYKGGQTEIYMKLYKDNIGNNIEFFPDEYDYEYIGEYTYAGKILHLDSNLYEKCMTEQNNQISNKTHLNCRFYITIKGKELSFFKGTNIDYSIFYSHAVVEISQNIPYKSAIKAGELHYYKFVFDSNTEGIYISLYSITGDADLYMNYGESLPSFNNYNWKSSHLQMDFLYIDKNDNYFIGNKKNSLEGVYTIMIYGYTNATYVVSVSHGKQKIIQLAPGIPSVCKLESSSEEKFCYFRVENFVNTQKILEEDAGGLSNVIQKTTEIIEKDVHIIFTTKFIYGFGNIYAKLFKETDLNIEPSRHLPNSNNYDYTNIQKNKRNFLKIDINKENPNLSPRSMLMVGVKCFENCLFEINSAQIEYDINFQFIDIDRENIFYITKQKNPLLLSFLQTSTSQVLDYEFYSYTGNANVKIFLNESTYDNSKNITNFHYTHISNFLITKKIPYYNFISPVNDEVEDKKEEKIKYLGNNREIFLEITPDKNTDELGFYVKLNYENEWIKTESMGKIVTYQINSNFFNGYFDLYNKYENVILSVKSDDSKLSANVYVTVNELLSSKNESIQKFSYPSKDSHTYFGKTNYVTSSVSIKIDKPGNSDKSIDINRRIFYKVELEGDFSKRNKNLAKTISILVSPMVNNLQRFEAYPLTIYYNTQKVNPKERAIFDLKKLNKNDNIFVIEISSCKGQFETSISNKISYFDETKNGQLKNEVYFEKTYYQGRMVLTGRELNDDNYYLSIWGTKLGNDEEKEELDEKNQESNLDIADKLSKTQMKYSNNVEFMVYYFTTNNKNYVHSSIKSYINPVYIGDGKVKLETSGLFIKEFTGKYSELDEINYKIFISTDINDYAYMSSLCYLSKMKELPPSMYSFNKEKGIYLTGLKKKVRYYVNMIIENPKSGELIILTPIIVEINNKTISLFSSIVIIIIILLLLVGTIYYRKKYIITEAELKYEKNDIRNMASLPPGLSNYPRNRNEESNESTRYINLNEEANRI